MEKRSASLGRDLAGQLRNQHANCLEHGFFNILVGFYRCGLLDCGDCSLGASTELCETLRGRKSQSLVWLLQALDKSGYSVSRAQSNVAKCFGGNPLSEII